MGMHQNPQSPMSLRDYATKRARILIGCYRKSEANDPEIYAAAVVAVLVRWPVDVITSVTEPATGLPSKFNWFDADGKGHSALPSIAEITAACEASYEPSRVRQSIENTRRMIAAPSPPRPTEAELDAVFARNGLMHLRPGSKANTRQPRHSDDERRKAQAVLDKYAAEAQGTENNGEITAS